MIINDADYVLRLWAASVRPSVTRLRPKGYEKPGEKDDRRLQARARVEMTEGFFKAKPCLWIVYVNETTPTERDLAVCAEFHAELGASLVKNPILIEDGPAVVSDFYVTVGQALALLKGYGTSVGERTLLRWCSEGLVRNYEQGRRRYVLWSQVVERAPKRRQKAA